MRYQLTHAQKRILYIDDLYPNSSISNIGGICYVPGNINYKILKESIDIFVKKNDVLHFKFKNYEGQVYQELIDCKCNEIGFIDFTNNKDKFDNWCQQFINESVSIYDDYLYKFVIFKLSEEKSGYIVKMHHIISDGYSTAIIFNQIGEIYDNILKIRESDIATTSYLEFIKLENEYLQSIRFSKDKEFWNDKFSNINEKFLYKEKYDCRGKSFKYTIPIEITNKLNKLLNENNITRNTFFMSLLYLYLYKKTGDKDIVIGIPVYNRANKRLRSSIGMFVSTVPMRFEVNNEISFKDFIKELNINLRNCYKHQNYPYDLLINDLQLSQKGFDGLFKIIFNYYNESFRYPMNYGETQVEEVTTKQVTFPLNLILREFVESELELEFEYRINEFDEEEIKIMCDCMMNMLVKVIDSMDISVRDVEMISPEEKEIILTKFNETKYIDNIEKYSICDFFEKIVEKYPDNMAIVYNGKKLSYRSLNNKANYLARILKDKGIKEKSVVGIISEKSLESIIGLLAILKAGGTYLPIDKDYPKERIIYMLNDSNAELLLSNMDFKLDYEIEKLKITNEELYLENPINIESNGNSIAYIMYTSGSTGRPKGVEITNKGVLRLVIEPNYIDLKPGDRMAQSGAMVFDAATFEIWGALLNGMTLFVLDKQIVLDPSKLKRTFEENKINVCWLTSPLFSQLCEADAETFNGLDYLITGGDIVSPKYVARVQKVNKNINIICGYGPTENTTFTTCFKIPKEWDENKSIPIGHVISGTKAYIVDPDNKLQPIGVEGELCTSGQGIAEGYVNNAELTEKSFVDNPFDSINSKMYRTGDLAKFTSDGKILFLGRKDNQIKINGFRIEISEIERVICEIDDIKQVKVLCRNNKLVCYYVAEKEYSSHKIKDIIKTKLPNYMIPTKFISLNSMPLNVNGKIDAESLKDLDDVHNEDIEYTQPRNNVEERLQKIWDKILETKLIGIYNNFMESGGNSLKAMTLRYEVEKEFGVRLQLKLLLEGASISELSKFINNEYKEQISNINRAEEREYYEVSPSQKRMYILNELDKKGIVYNIPLVFELNGGVDSKKLEKSVLKIIERHESLRTYFENIDGSIVQKITNITDIDFKLRVEHINEEYAKENTIKDLVRSCIIPFDLKKAPLIRAILLCMESEKSIFILDMHHIISDGISTEIFLKELKDLYEDRNLDDLNIQYKDYANWKNNLISEKAQEIEKQKTYWINRLNGIKSLELPTDYVRSATQNYEGRVIEVSLSERVVNGIEKISNDMNTTPYVVMMSIFNILLSKYSNQEDIVIGTPISERNNQDFKNIIGMFVNTVVIYNSINFGDSYKLYLNKFKDVLIEAMENSNYEFDQLISDLNIRKDPSRNPIFDVMFVWNELNLDEFSIGDVKVKRREIESEVSKFDLTMNILKNNDKINLGVEYSKKLFKEETIKFMITHYLNILEQLIENTSVSINKIKLIDKKEEKILLENFNDTRFPYDENSTIAELFEQQVKATPNNIAVVFNHKKITYKELNYKANYLANKLIKKGICAGSIVSVCMSKSIEYIIAILAVNKSGCTFLPIDVKYPIERKRFMIEDSDSKLLITNEKEYVNDIYNIEIIDINDIQFDMTIESIKENKNSIAYIIYTSGSTGIPKGVVIEHKGISNLREVYKNVIGINKEDKILQFASISFDASIWEITMALLSGAALYMVDDEIINNVNSFERYLNENNITVVTLPPVYLNSLNANNVDSLRVLITAGSSINKATLAPWFDKVRYINAYGPTESTICTTLWIHEKEDEIYSDEIIPIGKPILNSNVYIMNNYGEIQPIGIPGEICISGDMIANGYLNRDDITNKKFIKSKFLNNKRIYRTGDIGKWKNNGEIEYIGRVDDQIKLHGYRIELSEIENILASYRNIADVAVICKKNNNDLILAAYFTSSESEDISIIKNFLKKKLPEYMIPSILIQVDKFVINSSGKIDKKYLESLDININKEIVAPEGDIEKKLYEIWKSALDVNNFGVTDSFFEIGGSSISMIQVISKIENEFDITIGYKEFMFEKNIRNLSMLINSKNKSEKKQIELIHDDENKYEPFPLTQVQMAYLLGRNKKIEMGGRGTHAYVEIESELNIEKLNESLNKTINRHEMLRAIILDNGEQVFLNNVPEYTIVQRNLMDCSDEEIQIEIIKERNEMSHHVFDYKSWPLFEFKAFKISEDKSYIFISIDGLIADGSSVQIIIRDLLNFYHDRDYLSPMLDINFKDYITSYKSIQNSDEYNVDKEYWINKLENFPSAPQLPLKVKPETVVDPKFKRVGTIISKDEWKKIEWICKKYEITPSVLFCGIYAEVMSFWSNQEDVAINLSIFNRYQLHEQVNDLVGDFTSIILLDIHNNKENNFFEKCRNIQETLLEALEHRRYDGVEFIREYSKKHSLSNKAVMPIVFTSMIGNGQNEVESGALGKLKYGISQTPQVYIDMQISNNSNEELSINWDYVDEIFDQEIINLMFNQYIEQIKYLIKNEEIKPLELTEEHLRIIRRYNYTDGLVRKETLQKLFEEQVSKTPNNIAIEDLDDNITYMQLNKKANQVARYLLEKNEQRNSAIGVLTTRSIDTIINILGVLKAGYAYVPIDPSYPQERIDYIIKKSNINTLIESKLYQNEKLSNFDTRNLDVDYDDKDIAYIIFTSGSTGDPKGVVINQRAAVNTIIDINKKFNVNEKDRVIGLSSMSFDLSVYDIFGTLISGAALVLIEDQRDVEKVYSTIINKGITIWNSVPSTMESLTSYIEKKMTESNEEESNNSEDFIYWVPGKEWNIKNAKLLIDEKEYSEEIKKLFPSLYFATQGGISAENLALKFDEIYNGDFKDLIEMLMNDNVLTSGILDPHELFKSQGILYDKGIDEELIFIEKKYEQFKQQQHNRVIVKEPKNVIKISNNVRYPEEISNRKSHRVFDLEPIETEDFVKLISILRQEENSGNIRYNYSSAGGLYPIDAYLYIKNDRVKNIPGGLYYYNPVKNQLELIDNELIIDKEMNYFSNQSIHESSAMTLFLVYNSQVNMPKYGGDGYLYALIDTGIMVDKITQVAEMLNMGLCSIGVINNKFILDKLLLNKYQVLVHTVELGLKEKKEISNKLSSSIKIDSNESILIQNVNKVNSNNKFDSLRLIMLSGDYISLNLPGKIKSIFKNAETISLGGATEAAIWSIYYKINCDERYDESIPYGYPLQNQKLYILNKDRQLCPPQVIGEIAISGTGIADGYVNDEEKTQKSFIFDEQLGRMYLTGDYGVLTKKGYIKFLGRRDNQVKVNGYRVELNEIESKLLQCRYIEDAAVIDIDDDRKRKYLVAFVVSDSEINSDNLRDSLMESLPFYMIPRYFIKVESIPLTPNGKIDKKELRKYSIIKEKEQLTSKEVEITDFEKQLIEIWKDILNIDYIDIDDSIFELGGDSISLVRIQKEIDKVVPGKVKIMDVFQNYTIRKLSNFITENLRKDDYKDKALKKVIFSPEYFKDYSGMNASMGLLRFRLEPFETNQVNTIERERFIKKESIFISAYFYLINEMSQNNEVSICIKSKNGSHYNEISIDLKKLKSIEELIEFVDKNIDESSSFDLSDVQLQRKNKGEAMLLYSEKVPSSDIEKINNIYDFIILNNEIGDCMELSLEYNSKRIKESFAKNIFANYKKVLQAIIKNL